MMNVAATVLEAARLPHPVVVNGSQQMPLHGPSMAYSFDDPKAAGRHETQYFEMFVNRGIYHNGWTAVTRHSTPWIVTPTMPRLRRRRVGTLRDRHDWTQAKNIAAESRKAARPAAIVSHRGDEVQRSPARRPAGSNASTL